MKSVLMIDDLNTPPSNVTVKSLLNCLATGLGRYHTILGDRALVRIWDCDRVRASAYDDMAILKEFVSSIKKIRHLAKAIPNTDSPADQRVLSLANVWVYEALTLLANQESTWSIGAFVCECQEHVSEGITLRNSALFVMMMDFQLRLTRYHLVNRHANRRSVTARAAQVSAELIRTWKAFPELRLSVEAIMPEIEVEPSLAEPRDANVIE